MNKTYEEHDAAALFCERPGYLLHGHARRANAVDEEDLAAIFGTELVDMYVPVLGSDTHQSEQAEPL